MHEWIFPNLILDYCKSYSPFTNVKWQIQTLSDSHPVTTNFVMFIIRSRSLSNRTTKSSSMRGVMGSSSLPPLNSPEACWSSWVLQLYSYFNFTYLFVQISLINILHKPCNHITKSIHWWWTYCPSKILAIAGIEPCPLMVAITLNIWASKSNYTHM